MYSIWLITKQGKPTLAINVEDTDVELDAVENLAASFCKEMNGSLTSNLTTWIVINNVLTTIDEAIVG